MLLIFLAACACGLQATRGLDLPSGDVLVSATAECGVDAADGSPLPTPYRVCSGGPECERTCGTAGGQVLHSPELAVDGDRNSSWQSPPLSHYLAGGGGPQGEDLTLDLGQVGRRDPSRGACAVGGDVLCDAMRNGLASLQLQ